MEKKKKFSTKDKKFLRTMTDEHTEKIIRYKKFATTVLDWIASSALKINK